jgi:DNA-binding response OmpR family regulator
MHVLLLEDNSLLAELLCDALEQWGHSVSLVAAAETGRRLALVKSFDCAILDVQIEGGFSFDLADLLSEQGVQFLFCSGGHRDLIPARHLNRPFLQKPYTMS